MLLCTNPAVLPLLALLRLSALILRLTRQLIATIDRNNPSRPEQYSTQAEFPRTKKVQHIGLIRC
jgi:hypothetical protein